MRKQSIVLLLVVALATTMLVGSVPAATITFQDGLNGYAGTRDTYVSGFLAGSHEENYGNGELTALGIPDGTTYRMSALIRFEDMFGSGANQIPAAGMTIQSATMELYARRVYKVSWYWMGAKLMLTPWVEGSSVGTPEEGASCGEARRYRADGDYAGNPQDAWGTDGLPRPGADPMGPQAGVDYVDTFGPASTIPVDPGWMQFDVTAELQSWYDGSADNWGLYVMCARSGAGAIYRSSEYTDDVTERPKLTIQYIPEPATMALLGLGGLLLRRKRRG